MIADVDDPFVAAVERARRQLSRTEGKEVSIRELARRTGISNATLACNLKADGGRGRRHVSPRVVAGLAQVLPISA
jgi:hypothetical protein